MTELASVLHPAELARLRSARHVAQRATKILTFAVVCSLTTATVIVMAALAGNL